MLTRACIACLIIIVLSTWSLGSCNPQTAGQTEQQLPALDVSLLVPPAAEKLGSSAGTHLNSRSAPSGLLLRHRQHAQESPGHILQHAAAAAHDQHGSSGAQPSTVQDKLPATAYSQQQQHLQLQVQHPHQQQQSTKEQQQQHRAVHKGQELLLPEITSLKERQTGLQKDAADTTVLSATKQPHLQRQAQQRQGQQQQQQQPAKQQQQGAGEDGSDARPPPPPPYTLHSPVNPVCSEYHMPPHSVSPAPTASLAGATSAPTAAAPTAAAAVASDAGIAVARRRLTQLAPTNCGKLGTYVPNYYMGTDGSMFGVSIAPNVDGSVIAVGSPINGPDAKDPGGASVLTSWSDQTCEYAVVPVWQPEGCYKYFGAQVALSTDATTMVVMDGVEGIKTPTAEGNRPVVHVYRRYSDGTFVYMQKLAVAPRRAMAAAMAVSITGDAQMILVSFSVGEGFPDKRGSAQVFVLDGTKATAKYNYLQDLANLNMPAGTSVQFGQTSVISNNGVFIAVGTASNNNIYYNLAYMYKKDVVTGRFRVISSISSGEHLPDPATICTGVGLSESNQIAMSQSGQFVLKVENAMLVIYEWSGHGMTVTWKRRCQLQAPDGYTFRTTAGSLSIVEVGPKLVKFAAGAYVGTLEAPEQMAVFLYYLDAHKSGSCPYRPAEKHVHNDAFSNYGAGVALSLDGRLLIVGAPTAWDNNMDCQSGALYLIDVDEVADDGLEAKTVTQATNTNAGCVNGMDPNGNPCVTKQKHDPICKDVKLKDGRVIHYGAPGCSPTPPLTRSFWTASLPNEVSAASAGAPHAPFATSSLSAYTTVNPSIKGGVGVPTGSDTWLANQAKAAVQASYFGMPTAAITKPKESIVSASGWPSSVQPALGGLKSHLNTVGSATAAPPGISALSLLSSGIGALLNKASGGAAGSNLGAAGAGIGRSIGIGMPVGAGPVLPAGAVIRNLDVLRQQPQMTGIGVPAAPAAAPAAAAPAAQR